MKKKILILSWVVRKICAYVLKYYHIKKPYGSKKARPLFWMRYKSIEIKNLKLENGENSRNFSKFKKTKISVLGKAHAKFQEASWIKNTQKSKGTVQ